MYKIVEIENSTIKNFKSNLITKYFSKVGVLKLGQMFC